MCVSEKKRVYICCVWGVLGWKRVPRFLRYWIVGDAAVS